MALLGLKDKIGLPNATELSNDELLEKIEAGHQKILDWCQNPQRQTMSIPPRLDDFDIVTIDGLLAGKELHKRLAQRNENSDG